MRVTLRQLCALGLPATTVLPALLPVLRELVGADNAAFFYCSAKGDITSMYAERLPPPQAMARYHREYFMVDFRHKYRARVAASSPISRYSVTAQDKATEQYRQVVGQLGGDHILYAIVRHGKQVLGQLSLYRSPGGVAFSDAQEQALADVLHYLGAALSVPTPTPLAANAARISEEAMAVLTPAGEVLFADAQWDRLVRLARGEVISPSNAYLECQALPHFVRKVLTLTFNAPSAVYRVESPWGSFVFRHHLLGSAADAEGAEVVALRVSRLTAEPLQLTLGAAALDLSPQQREVALLLARGHSNAEVAKLLHITQNTASYHVKQVFARLGVHDRGAVGRVLRQAPQ